MDRVAVKSTEIAIVGYDSRNSKLEITFRRGGVYRYAGVPGNVYDELMNAESQGSYFAENIKEKYPFTKVS